ncbi:CPBP family intramembrane glutamic endopeptidase [Alteromonas facilis]|uniref:CPBP family intramembrane glutamic endopeptidase n=1 Tax=Alteromonas facilis TaxID=2048004 RepID=UPI000C29554D|nr:CPBP family intramembrane glutamic endopeptidase [Alteromonas facilis]
MDSIQSANNNHTTSSIPVAIALFIATLATQLAPLLVTEQSVSLGLMLVQSVVFLSILTIPSLFIGFRLGKPLQLSIVNPTVTSKAALRAAVYRSVLYSVVIGVSLLALRWAVVDQLPDTMPEYGFRGPLGGFLVSLGAAVGEEVLFRFGIMTLLLWIAVKLFKTNRVTAPVAWTVILLVAFGFDLAHIPQVIANDAATSFAVWATILGNVVVGSLYGWCYWRYGLAIAMVAHFSVDIVLHVLPALF